MMRLRLDFVLLRVAAFAVTHLRGVTHAYVGIGRDVSETDRVWVSPDLDRYLSDQSHKG